MDRPNKDLINYLNDYFHEMLTDHLHDEEILPFIDELKKYFIEREYSYFCEFCNIKYNDLSHLDILEHKKNKSKVINSMIMWKEISKHNK